METRRAKLTGISPYAFRPGESSFIIGVALVIPAAHMEERLCYHVIYDDGQTDYIPVSEVGTAYEITGE